MESQTKNSYCIAINIHKFKIRTGFEKKTSTLLLHNSKIIFSYYDRYCGPFMTKVTIVMI